ncbi:Membrane (myristylated) protein [Lymphocystis disease virus 1]|uniref:Membrane (myristylated) protein n=1 Tax=Fish lymphocystis disease virus TaxID=36363 RepID=UPI0000161EB9|nr:Membrane (myristylated) protein [Lymphocystis disease virus 1]
MSNIITGQTLQKNKSKVKIVGACTCGSCSAFTARKTCSENEFLMDYVSCCKGFCTSQPKCLEISEQDCDIGNSMEGKTPLLSVARVQATNNIQCKYDLTKINTLNQVMRYTEKFGKSDILAERYCMQRTKNNMSRTSETDNNWCSIWLNNASTTVKDLAVKNYCKKNSDSTDCQCINRYLDPAYQKLKMIKNFSDACWYVPCSSNPLQLKPSNLENPVCPTSYCQSIVQVLQANNVSIKDVSEKINCSFTAVPAVKPGAVVKPNPAVKPGAVVKPNPAVKPGAVVKPNPAVKPGAVVKPNLIVTRSKISLKAYDSKSIFLILSLGLLILIYIITVNAERFGIVN